MDIWDRRADAKPRWTGVVVIRTRMARRAWPRQSAYPVAKANSGTTTIEPQPSDLGVRTARKLGRGGHHGLPEQKDRAPTPRRPGRRLSFLGLVVSGHDRRRPGHKFALPVLVQLAL